MTHFLDIHATEVTALRSILDSAHAMKAARAGRPKGTADDETPLAGHMVALVFEKPSTRTRVSFDVGLRQLGGESIVLTGKEMQLGHGESIADTARVLTRYVDLIMIRTFEEASLLELAEHATVPVINGLTNRSHPCQIMADVMTFEEHRGPIAGKKVTWLGDGNNVCASFLHAAGQFGFDMAVAGPDLVETDTWVSMHDAPSTRERRHNLLRPYQVNEALMAHAADDALFMHCLPAHRGEEATDAIMDGPHSVVFDEAENRLHVQKAIMRWCLGL